MNNYNFNEIIDRKNTNSLKYDFAVERGKPSDVVPFWVADMDFRVPQQISDALVTRAQHGIFGYTQYKADYTDILKNWFKKRFDWSIDKKWLVITPGVVFAISTAITALTSEGDAVLIQRPVYYPFSETIHKNNRKIVNNPLVYKDGVYSIDFNDFEQKIIQENVKLFILCNPHNPVGRVWTKQELIRIGDICTKYGVIVVSDEIHADFIHKNHEHTVFASISEKYADITITCTSPSKSFNLAGLQISNIFISNDKIRHSFKKRLSQIGFDEPNTFGLIASHSAYSLGEQWLDELKIYIQNNINLAKEFIINAMPKVKVVDTEGTYLLWLDFSGYGLNGHELDEIIINKAGLWLDGGTMFGPEGEGFQRINAACPWVVLEEGLKKLAVAFDIL
jgi:cystathionine beta-lyase